MLPGSYKEANNGSVDTPLHPLALFPVPFMSAFSALTRTQEANDQHSSYGTSFQLDAKQRIEERNEVAPNDQPIYCDEGNGWPKAKEGVKEIANFFTDDDDDHQDVSCSAVDAFERASRLCNAWRVFLQARVLPSDRRPCRWKCVISGGMCWACGQSGNQFLETSDLHWEKSEYFEEVFNVETFLKLIVINLPQI